MKRLSLILMVVGLLALGGQTFAELCTIDAVPAASLLVPYFEVSPDGNVTTLFSVNNASAAPALVHVIFWTDWTYPTLDFDIYLSGYDVATVNVRDVFDGNLYLSADAPNDPLQAEADCGDNIQGVPGLNSSPCGGVWSQNRHWDDTDAAIAAEQGFPGCDAIFPFFTNPVVGSIALDRLVNGHRGDHVGGTVDDCVGDDWGDENWRGYITLDNVSQCSLVLDPGSLDPPAYFSQGGTGIANNNNQLWGDWFLVDFANNFAQGDTLVHIEADASLDGVNAPDTGYTFYGRYTGGADNREPLGTIWGSRYLNGGVFDQTQLIVWRDSTCDLVEPDGGDSQCGGVGPDWFPLNETEVIGFNEAEDAIEICIPREGGGVVSPPDPGSGDPACFPWETARYNWGVDDLAVPFNFGWAYLNLNLPPDTCGADPDSDFGADGNIAQSFVTTLHSALGRFSVGLSAVEFYSACQNFNVPLNGRLENGGVNVIAEDN